MTLLSVISTLLPFMIFIGAALQVAGGMGFGVIAGPLLLVALGPSAGMQAAVMLNIAVAAFGWLSGRNNIQYALVLHMIPGILIGLAIGLAAALLTPGWFIKVALCISLGWICLLPATTQTAGKADTLKFAIFSGLMGGALSIPGPAAAVYLRRRIKSAHVLRSTMMPLLTFAYLLIGLVLAASQQLNSQAITTTIHSMPFVIAGLLAGIWLAKRIASHHLKVLTQVVLLATFASLVIVTTLELAAKASVGFGF